MKRELSRAELNRARHRKYRENKEARERHKKNQKALKIQRALDRKERAWRKEIGLLTMKECANYLDISLDRFTAFIKRGWIPTLYRAKDRNRYYTREQLDLMIPFIDFMDKYPVEKNDYPQRKFDKADIVVIMHEKLKETMDDEGKYPRGQREQGEGDCY